MAAQNKHGLGRGLGALLGDDGLNLGAETSNPQASDGSVKYVRVSDLTAGRFQPRREFDSEAIRALADSIREKGVLQPILVRKAGSGYEIIAGERRYRAACQAGLAEVPVIEKQLADNEALEIALIENIVRQDLTALEEAAGFEQLISRFSYTQEKLSSAVGKSRSYIANSLRLLSLPDGVKDFLKDGRLSAGHARALVGLENAAVLAAQIVREGLNVRQAEALAAAAKTPQNADKTGIKTKTAINKDSELTEIENSLSQKFGLKVQINAGKNGKGKVSFLYNDFSELESIIEKLEN